MTHNLISWFAGVHQVGQQDGVFGARQAARRHFPRTLLNGDSLVVLIHGLLKARTSVNVQNKHLLPAAMATTGKTEIAAVLVTNTYIKREAWILGKDFYLYYIFT